MLLQNGVEAHATLKQRKVRTPAPISPSYVRDCPWQAKTDSFLTRLRFSGSQLNSEGGSDKAERVIAWIAERQPKAATTH